MSDTEITLADKTSALRKIAEYHPAFVTLIVVLSVAAALLEGIGLTFLLPIIEVAQSSEPVTSGDGVIGVFLYVYGIFGIPFSLEYITLGVALIMAVRYSASFTSTWLAAKLNMEYEGHLKDRAYSQALYSEVSYYDENGSDHVLNAIVTQTRFAGRVIRYIVSFLQESLLALMYLAVAFYLAPRLTLLTVLSLGGVTYVIRHVIEPGYTVGDRVAEANQEIQRNVQAGTQGIRDVKLFRLNTEMLSRFRTQLDRYVISNTALRRNKAAIKNLYELSVAVLLFVLIYVAVEVFSLTLGALGVFLFAVFRLAPRVSTLNSRLYTIEGDLPHLVRTHRFIDELSRREKGTEQVQSVPDRIEHISFDDVSFSYETSDQPVLQDVSFRVDRGEFVAFVGQSGAGKSTLVSLFVRLYEPDDGCIRVNDVPIGQFDRSEWRAKVGMVRQDPHIFNETLNFNLTVGNRDASREEIERAARIARVDEFVNDLPDGYETDLGDEGIQLSGGQRQRVSLARALLTDPEVLVLDEATSDLDSSLEREIQDELERLEDEYTVFVIAHRLSTVENADKIYTMANGRITEAGTHQELIQSGGTYAELYEIQT